MIYIINLLEIYIRKLFLKLNKGYRYYNQKIDFNKILTDNFKENKKFVFIQVGANDGISFDDLNELITRRDAEGIVIEPVKEYFDQLSKNYSKNVNIIKVNKAVHPSKKKVIIFKVSNKSMGKYPNWVKGIASLNQKHHCKSKIDVEDIVSEEVDSDKLMNIIVDFKNKAIDYFQTDTEGFDLEVIKMIDFKCIKPKIIKYESIHLSKSDKKTATKILNKEDYHTFEIGADTVAINLKKIKIYWK